MANWQVRRTVRSNSHGKWVINFAHNKGPYVNLKWVDYETKLVASEDFEVINIWDYSKDELDQRMKVDGGLAQIVDEWLKDVTPMDFDNYLEVAGVKPYRKYRA